MKKILTLILLILPFHNFSQTGPGGVGTTDGTSNLVLWLDANTVTGSHGSTITSWNDNSGYGFDFTVGNGAIFNNPSVNGYPAFNFNGTNQYFEHAYTAVLNPANFTIFSATNVTSSGLYKAVISNRDDPPGAATAGYILYSKPTSNNWAFWTGTPSSWATSNSTSTAGSWSGQVLEYQNTASGKKFYLDGATSVTSTHGMTLNPSRPCRIGAGRNESTPDYYYNGDISEIIIFDLILNSAERIIVNNYLSAKYNYSLSNNDIFNEDNVGSGDYDHDVAGIGRIDAANIHDDSQGTGIVRILNPTNLGNNEFLFWGHDNGILQATNIIDLPAGIQARFDRVWRVSEQNSTNSGSVNVGDIDIRWDLTGLGSVTASDLRLLIDTDNDGVFSDETPISGATDLGSNIFEFSAVSGGAAGIIDDRRFTLGTINNIQTPLPIELVSFNAHLNNNNVELDWKTESEINNDFFTIERSKNGEQWDNILEIDGLGNSTLSKNYSAIDKNSLDGISYYRLKQTDFNGQHHHYKTIRIEKLPIANNKINFYPNPTNNYITINGNEIELEYIYIYNILGQNLTDFTTLTEINKESKVIDLSNLSNGTYYIKTKNNVQKLYKK